MKFAPTQFESEIVRGTRNLAVVLTYFIVIILL